MFPYKVDADAVNARLNQIAGAYQLPNALQESNAVLTAEYTLDNYRNSIFSSSANLSESPSSMDYSSQPTLLVGQGITANDGILLNSINKVPSYHLSSKTDDVEHHTTKTKHILSGLGTSDSVSTLGIHNIGSSSLNNKLVRLPLKGENTDNKQWSLVNGLPYYDKETIDKEIRYLNQRKARSSASGTQFSAEMNETIDDVEYLHGAVILNQYLNNKRLVRNYQWLMYYKEKRGGHKLGDAIKSNDSIKFQSVQRFQKSMERKMRLQMERRRRELEGMPQLSEEELKNNEEEEEDDIEVEGPRFQSIDIPVNLTKELIIEKVLPIDEKELIQAQDRLYGIQNSYQMLQDAKQTDGIIHSKLLRLRRKPNPNALGYSNIRSKKPPYA
ncbi:hypothetical protein OGAPHI_001209 [Ogataea philodendri]|uniref:Uncharacterized protein n=1 Tax=Ogataea philodendri TaxID=1378263 RepID=A0A9P8PG86_9ASCO|nr:uncharacterized protein OGAPHI_001209 [Ogataea philodendri]KAH3670694.1 hypothetical protein OGAPHI_001209 [Ogataea philodendri]